MTVVVWDGERLAADKRISNEGHVATTTKIFRHKGQLLGLQGLWPNALQLLEWYKRGADPDEFPGYEWAEDDIPTLLVIDKDKRIFKYNRGPYPAEYEEKQVAIGNGMDFAMAALHYGHSAIEAVKLACTYLSDCGNGIDVLEHEHGNEKGSY